MRTVKFTLLGVAVLTAVVAGWLSHAWNDRPSLAAYQALLLPPAEEDAGLRVRFMGVSTLLFEDGETAILIDGFLSRPSLATLIFGKVAPDEPRIERYLQRAGIDRLAAVIGVHSHYDHVMDAPAVAQHTGAVLIGSESTANVGRGWGLAEDQLRVVKDEETLRFGRFTVTLLRSRHAPVASADGGVIAAPLVPPARATAYKEGGSYSVLLEHEGRSALVQGSAGFIEGALQGRAADVVFLGIGAVGKQGEAYLDAYWQEVVAATGARRVIPIHWDDFTQSLDAPLVPMPRLIDDFDASMRFLIERGRVSEVDVRLPPVWTRFDPFARL